MCYSAFFALSNEIKYNFDKIAAPAALNWKSYDSALNQIIVEWDPIPGVQIYTLHY